MRIVVTYASVGYGHFKAAEAISRQLKDLSPDAKISLVDILGGASALFSSIYAGGYGFLVSKAPFLWGLVFWITRHRALGPLIRGFFYPVSKFFVRSYVKWLIQENPDCLVSTHFFPSELAAKLKKKKLIKSRLITVLTDLGVHPAWIWQGTDLYIVGSDAASRQLTEAGIEKEKIKIIGIPVDEKFSKLHDLAVLKRKLQLCDKFTVLLISGSFGTGPLQKIVDRLYPALQLIVVCARNKHLYKRLKRKQGEGLRIFGFVDNIHDLMLVSSVIVTKPGGQSIAEALNVELPPIFLNPIPGQEVSNIKILKGLGIGMVARNIAQLEQIIAELRDNPQKLQEQKQKIREFKRPEAAKEICRVICEDCP